MNQPIPTPPEPQPGATPDLAAIQARCDAATPGPWRTGPSYVVVADNKVVAEMMSATSCERDADAAFIAHARTDIPALLAALATSRAETEAARAERDAAARCLEDQEPTYCYIRCEKHSGVKGDHDEGAECNVCLTAQLATLTATLAQREAENDHMSFIIRNRDNMVVINHKIATMKIERDTAVARVREAEEDKLMADSLLEASRARVRELEDDGRRLDWLERNGQWHDPENRFKVTFQMETVKYTSLRECVDVAAARAAGTGEEGGRA